jgi:hypothetical protein
MSLFLSLRFNLCPLSTFVSLSVCLLEEQSVISD